MENPDSLVEYGFRRGIIVLMAVLCALLEIVDTTIVNVALDSMKGSLGVTLEDVAWVVTAYAIANVIMVFRTEKPPFLLFINYLVVTSTSRFIPGRRYFSIGSFGFTNSIDTGSLCTTFTKFPEALSGGKREN